MISNNILNLTLTLTKCPKQLRMTPHPKETDTYNISNLTQTLMATNMKHHIQNHFKLE